MNGSSKPSENPLRYFHAGTHYEGVFGLFYRFCDGLRDSARRRQNDGAAAQGKRGEDLAHRFLQKQGYTIIARNYRTATGNAEVDLVCLHDDVVVFVEVKTRATDEFGAPDRAVDTVKRNRIRRGALEFLRASGRDEALVRFDLVSIVLGKTTSLQYRKDAFTVERP